MNSWIGTASAAAPAANLSAVLAPFGAGQGAPAPTAAPAAGSGNGAATNLPTIHDEDVAKCVNCKTCYQQVPELFEKITIVEDGVAKEVARAIPGALSRVKITPELEARVRRLVANCDSEIIK
jgi:pyruvate-ferredoxin/flavodoxin oxidoreductase